MLAIRIYIFGVIGLRKIKVLIISAFFKVRNNNVLNTTTIYIFGAIKLRNINILVIIAIFRVQNNKYSTPAECVILGS
ncbi:unnamed protein product [Cuscuta campestris]|uniref:Uncharacterized protein n=1 Tax=Cuscuta campestris TaxID=132261 RepID=A0A484NDG0_9ASTE|nr:unnamed protein product [Cuscuta campestris]